MPYNLLGGQYLNPIIVGVVNEIESHGGIFKTYPAVFLVILADCIIVSGHAEAEMAFVLAQFVGLGMFFQAGQFQKKTRAAVGEIDQCERAVRRLFPMMFLQSQCLFVESDAAFQVGDVYIKMVEFAFYFHCCYFFRFIYRFI